ncbi:fibronectin type III domain-containing protein, partial [Patescibacteria group bacterium]
MTDSKFFSKLKTVSGGRLAVPVTVGTVLVLSLAFVASHILAQVAALAITSGPYVSGDSVTETTAQVGWETNIPSTSLVEYGTTTRLGQSQGGEQLVTSHAVTLTSLQPDTLHYYRVKSVAADESSVYSTIQTLRTLARDTVCGDETCDSPEEDTYTCPEDCGQPYPQDDFQ